MSKQEVASKCDWYAKVDERSGRMYYVNNVTHVRQWDKPDVFLTEEELVVREKQRRESAAFFSDMETNIYRKYNEASRNRSDEKNYSNEYGISGYHTYELEQLNDEAKPSRSSSNNQEYGYMYEYELDNVHTRDRLNSNGGICRMVRTMSSLDDAMLDMMRSDNKLHRISSGARIRTGSDDLSGATIIRSESKDYLSMGYSPSVSLLIERKDSYDRGQSPRRVMKGKQQDAVVVTACSSGNNGGGGRFLNRRRNSTGTIYVGSTMSKQNNDATIKAVSAVIRTHIKMALMDGVEPRPEFNVFLDPIELYNLNCSSTPPPVSIQCENQQVRHHLVPSLDQIVTFFNDIFSKSQLESECIIMAFIYCERLVKITKGKFCVRHDNWRSILFTCLIMASKVWDDLSMWNVDFSQVSPHYSLKRINELELKLLESLNFVIRVSASEYAKYYFHLRSIMAKLKIVRNEINYLKPLSFKTANDLQLSTERLDSHNALIRMQLTKSNSIGDLSAAARPQLRSYDDSSLPDAIGRSSSGLSARPLLLEDVIHNAHVDIDGGVCRVYPTQRNNRQPFNAYSSHK